MFKESNSLKHKIKELEQFYVLILGRNSLFFPDINIHKRKKKKKKFEFYMTFKSINKLTHETKQRIQQNTPKILFEFS